MKGRTGKMVAILGVVLAVSGMALAERDEDYHPQGDNSKPSAEPFYEGQINRLEDYSDQLQPGMGTSIYGLMSGGDPDTALDGHTNVDGTDDAKWHDSMGGEDRADQFALTKSLDWAISNRGVPYEPGRTYYHDDYGGLQRIETTDDSVEKTVKVFGNSLAVTAGTSLSGQSGTDIQAGDGIWIDPDDLRQLSSSGQIQENWGDVLRFNIDITGPDSGLGLNIQDGTGLNYPASGYKVIYGDVYFEGEHDNQDQTHPEDSDGSVDEGWSNPSTVGERKSTLEPPMCGDDQQEFLMEEIGESRNPEKFNGRFACTDSNNVCVDRSSTYSKIVPNGTYRQMDEPDEEYGRLKNDKERCLELTVSQKNNTQTTQDYVPIWYDQDYTAKACRTNTYYGDRAVRWVSKAYVQFHPLAVNEGIDDDWNSRFHQKWEAGDIAKNWTSHPEFGGWSDAVASNYSFSQSGLAYSPVPSGARKVRTADSNTSIATMGFCGGDDEGEFFVTQVCNTQACDTNRNVYGVSDTPGSCVLAGDKAKYDVGVEERKIYDPGENVTFHYSGTTQTATCYNGIWYGKWPVSFTVDNLEVPFGEYRSVQFSLINPESTPTTYTVNLLSGTGDPNWNDAWAGFAEQSGTTFTTTVSGESSKIFAVEVYGGDKAVDSVNLGIVAESRDGDFRNLDNFTVDVVPTGTGTGREPADVPGIGLVQVLLLLAAGASIYLINQ
ncbi:MAG: hypothetical protein ABEK01_04330 [Candidatus Nanohaloarchaea archaeon]